MDAVAIESADVERNLEYAGQCVEARKFVHLDKPPGADLERLRNEGDHRLGELLMWASDPGNVADPERAKAIQSMLRQFISDQLKVDISIMAKPMFHELATGEEPESKAGN